MLSPGQIKLRPPAPLAAAAVVVSLLAATACLLGAQDHQANDSLAETQTSALINQQLDAPIDLSMVNRPLPEVLRQIEQQTGVPVLVSEETYALLPYGRETPINVSGKATLRQTLDLIGSAMGLEHVLRQENVEFRPHPALQRIGRRSTVQDLAGMYELRRTRLNLQEDRPTIAQLLEAIDLKLAEMDETARQRNEPPPGFQVENRLDETLRSRPVFVSRNATLLSALEAVGDQTGATWYPWGDSFIVLAKEDWVRQRLETPVMLSTDELDAQEALLELQTASGVPFSIEPGALQHVPERFRRIRLYVPDKSVRNALESLGSYTGLAYTVTDKGVYIYHSQGRNRTPPRPSGGELPALMVDLGDGTSLLLYASELPEELRQHLEQRRREEIDRLRQNLAPPPAEPEN